MTADGKVITPPSYSEITAISYDSYLCKDSYSGGIILNGKGERIRCSVSVLPYGIFSRNVNMRN